MKYYIKDNEIQGYKSEGSEEYLSPIHPDGKTILPKHEALEYDEEGNITNPEVVAILEAERLEQELQEAKQAKEETLKKLTVTLSDGKVFYADAESRIDLRDAIELGIELNQTSTAWKLAEDFNGSRIVEVTIDELKEASKLALMTKGNIVGAI